MNELEMEIGRTLGASCFFIYQTVKANPNFSARDVQMETGLSENCVCSSLAKLRHSNVLERKRRTENSIDKTFVYKENKEKDSWKLQ